MNQNIFLMNGEIDCFAIKDGKKGFYAYLLVSGNTIRRGLGVFKPIKDASPKVYVVA